MHLINKLYNFSLTTTSSDQLFELLPLILPVIDAVLILFCIAYIVYVIRKRKSTKDIWLYFLLGGITTFMVFLVISFFSPPILGVFPLWIIVLQIFTIIFGLFAYSVWWDYFVKSAQNPIIEITDYDSIGKKESYEAPFVNMKENQKDTTDNEKDKPFKPQ